MNDERFHKNPKWLKLRKSILRRDGYMCQYCKRYGKCRQAEHVHHMLPREFYPEYTYSPWNLISLCGSCHDIMHNRSDRTLSDKGKEILKIFARKNNIDLEKILNHEKEYESSSNNRVD